MVAAKTCSRCFVTYEGDEVEVFFYSRKGIPLPICIGCELTARTQKTRANRWLQKARDTRRHHANRLGRTVEDLTRFYGWHLMRMAHEAQHVYKNGCQECGLGLEDMGHGLSDLTLDIFDPTGLPTYGANTRWICITCNRAKGDRPPRLHAAWRSAWARWQTRSPSTQLTLNLEE